jgi:glycosyltransferase involved in cell wall biosynthesis
MSTKAATRAPLISIVWNGCNRPESVVACLDALRNPASNNFELVVQSSNSTDGTLEIFTAAARTDDRIRIMPMPAADSGDGLLSALRVCRGDYVACWPMQGRLVLDALELAVTELAQRPHLGMVCGSGFLVDGVGRELEPVDIVTLLFTSYRLFLPAGVFRRHALEQCGLHRDGWLTESLDVDLCLRIATDFGIYTTTRRLVDCQNPMAISDGLPMSAASAIEERMRIIARTFSTEGFFGPLEALHLEAVVNHLSILWQRFSALGIRDADYLSVTNLRLASQRLHFLLRVDHRVLRSLHRLFGVRSHNLGLLSTPLQKLLTFSSRLPERAQMHLNYQIWNCTLLIGYWLKRKIIAHTQPLSDFHPSAPTRAEMLADVYALVAARYESRGQIDLALEMWERARPPNNVNRDSSAAQALLRLPSATDASIAQYQKKWVDRHVGIKPVISLRTANVPAVTRKVRIGYHCAFMDSDTIRYMMRNVMAAHDRSRFEVYGYSPKQYPADLVASFDVRRDTNSLRFLSRRRNGRASALSDAKFVSLVRKDEIDVFVELSGFSPGNRFRAMSERCAPVQVSFLNHTGSSQVPNVDYIVTDEICTPTKPDIQPYYSETLWRLPGCFFSFDYRGSECPPLNEPPSQRRGYTTYGCFGHGGKLNSTLIGIWAEILRRCPGSLLCLQNPQFNNDDTRRFIANQFQQYGISHDRIVLAKGVDRNSLLGIYNQIDISLDTWPYCGGGTVDGYPGGHASWRPVQFPVRRVDIGRGRL